MRTFALLVVFLLVALFTLSEARNRQARCQRCRSQPPPGQRVCAHNGVRALTFPSRCQVERRACRTGRDFAVVSEGGPCPRPGGQGAGRPGGGDTASSESREDDVNSAEAGDGDGNATPSVSPVRTTVTPPTSQTPTSPPAVSAPGTNAPPPPPQPPVAAGSTPSAGSASPAPATGQQTAAATGAPAASSPGPTPADADPVTARQCDSYDNCVPSSSVCGTDGSTYPSQCVLEVTACLNNLDTLTVAYAGVCSA